jgi:HEPN domain-containing protein
MESKIIKKWIAFIEADLSAAKVLYQNAIKKKKVAWHSWMLIIWHCHQVAEKSLKMVIISIISKGKELLRIHDLPRLLDQAEIKNFPLEWKEKL